MLCESRKLSVNFGALEAVRDFSCQIDYGKIVCLLGANGAGKSTILRAISGLVPLATGEIFFSGEKITGSSPHNIVKKGISHVLEQRRLFCEMNVMENLQMGAHLQTDSAIRKRTLDEVLAIFPPLRNKLFQRAGTLSGGEQQMTAIGRALMNRPRLLLMDEPTLGLSPILCEHLIDRIVEINKRGTSILLAEQKAELVLPASDEGYLLSLGRLVLAASSRELMADERVKRTYLGV